LRVASHVTFAQPRQQLIPELPEGRILAANLPLEEAAESLEVTLAGFMKPRKAMIEKLPHIQIDAQGVSLVYVPFREAHLEFIQPDIQIAINKNIMTLAKNL
jgi:hypothetical protein